MTYNTHAVTSSERGENKQAKGRRVRFEGGCGGLGGFGRGGHGGVGGGGSGGGAGGCGGGVDHSGMTMVCDDGSDGGRGGGVWRRGCGGDGLSGGGDGGRGHGGSGGMMGPGGSGMSGRLGSCGGDGDSGVALAGTLRSTLGSVMPNWNGVCSTWKRYVSCVTVSTACTTTDTLRASPVSSTVVDLSAEGVLLMVTQAAGSAVCNVINSCQHIPTAQGPVNAPVAAFRTCWQLPS